MSGERVPGRCSAKRRDGGLCRNWPAPGRRRCRLHGGASLRGPAHPNWKDGRRSRYALPARLRAALERVMGDPSALELYAEIEVTRALIADVLAGIEGQPTARQVARLSRFLHAAARLVEAQTRQQRVSVTTLSEAEGLALARQWGDVLRQAVERVEAGEPADRVLANVAELWGAPEVLN